ncbi:hypothetical protein [Paenibacillus sp. sgz500958]|uniref:hypothetical protein n=1 Tax=Paenibacillus sp. sgz500958 TaxID=3242475 RepID=UPI0036D30626
MSDFIRMHQLGFSESEIESFNQNKIEYNKRASNILKKSREDSKKSQCYICGKDSSSFCNSHSVPRYCLEHIALNGRVYYSGNLVDTPMFDKEKGVNEAGTFRIICRNCDSTVFSDYENPENYSNVPTDKMLSQMAMKNYLKNISKRELEISLYNNLSEMSGNDLSQQQIINELDLNEYINGFEYAKKASESKWNNNYYLFYYEILDYVVPIAFQNNVSLVGDLEGGVINNIYHSSADYVLKDIHICVFPLKNTSVVLMFIKNGESRYRAFFKQFKRLSVNEKLKVINYILFSYSEDVFIYGGLADSLLKDERLKLVAKQTPIAIADSPFFDPLAQALKTFDLNKRSTIPNLLDENYKVR